MKTAAFLWGPCSPRLGCSLCLVLLTSSMQGGLHKGRFLQQKWGAGSRADTPVPGLQMSPVGTGEWKPKHRERLLQGGKKIKGIEMK